MNRVSRKARTERRSGEAIKVFPDGREVCQRNDAGWAEYDRRLCVMVKRQGFRCAWCLHLFGFVIGNPTFDHEDGRGLGGSHRDDRILHADGTWKNAALCRKCNGLKGSQRFAWVLGIYGLVTK